MLGDSFEYTKEALIGKWTRWFLLIICAIIFPLFGGYSVRIMSGAKPAPELENWGSLFIDGIKLLVLGLIYSIPVMIVAFLVLGGSIMALASGSDSVVAAGIAGLLGGLLIVLILALIIGLISIMGMIRFSRTGSMGEAFNFSAIFETIGKIGWVHYIIAVVVMVVLLGVVYSVLGMIPVIGWLLSILLMPAFGIFEYRYFTAIYESVETS
ncbi:MAG: DUF4013 domain-containing protein [Methanogenium sp.]|nr:DUF4013 domain-containing protein [Methanogenium sp.]